jgi:dipeptidyl aminopeptidase/acylaminoacyl peptidase
MSFFSASISKAYLFLLTAISLFLLFFSEKGFSMVPPSSLIPRKVLFGNPDKALVKISPNGKYLTYIAPLKNVLNLWLQPLDPAGPAIPLTHDTGRGIQSYTWAYNNNHILYIQDRDGDENWRLFKIDINTKEITTLTDQKNVRVEILATSHLHPYSVLIGINDRDPAYHDIYSVDLQTNAQKKIYENKEFGSFVIDDNLRLRLGCKITETGGMDWFIQKNGQWDLYRTFTAEDTATSGPVGFSKEGAQVYWLDSEERNFAALTLTDIKTNKTTVLATPSKTDFSSITFHPTENIPLWLGETYFKPEKKFLKKNYEKDFKYLSTIRSGIPSLVSSTLDFNQWVVSYLTDNGPIYYYLYNRLKRKADYLFAHRPNLENLPLAPMLPFEIKSRDGLSLVSYLTLPFGLSFDTAHQLPTVLLVHGGPESRDTWGYNPQHQWLANRGYAVLSVNYRGSSGFGKKFVSAGDKESARKMHNDLIDAVHWLIQKKISDPSKIAIMGGSYGGYATLVGLTMTPDVFACGVDIVGVSNLMTLLQSIPPYWKPFFNSIIKKYGDPRTKEGQKLLKESSPLTYFEQIKKPLLIAHGANDPRVKQAESDQIVGAMKKKNIPVTYLLYPDEGHGFAKPENRISFYAVAEKFLADCLGGRFESVGEDFKGSSIQVKEGSIQQKPIKTL